MRRYNLIQWWVWFFHLNSLILPWTVLCWQKSTCIENNNAFIYNWLVSIFSNTISILSVHSNNLFRLRTVHDLNTFLYYSTISLRLYTKTLPPHRHNPELGVESTSCTYLSAFASSLLEPNNRNRSCSQLFMRFWFCAVGFSVQSCTDQLKLKHTHTHARVNDAVPASPTESPHIIV